MDIPWNLPRPRFAILVPAIVLALLALLMITLHSDHQQQIASQKSTGLGAPTVGWDPISLWKRPALMTYINSSPSNTRRNRVVGGVIGGVPGGVRNHSAELQSQIPISDKKLIRMVALELVVRDVRAAAEQLRRSTESFEGDVENLSIAELDQQQRGGTLKLRVPAAQLENALADFKKSSIRVQREEIQAREVTREYADNEARLRNMQAEEQQYLVLLRRAGSMKDTLEVTGRLSDVRGEIERMQANLNFTALQVAMSAVDVTLIQEADAQVAGLHWRPLFNAKLAAREMLTGLADWVDFLVALLLKLPLIIIWLVTIVGLVAIAWKAVRWLWRRFFPDMKLGLNRPEPAHN